LPPFVAYRVDRMDEPKFTLLAEQLRERMKSLETIAPIPYRKQNYGDYQIPTMELLPGLVPPGAQGFAVHLAPERD
ncbi:flavodoxin family protein, partial [Ameyamaea chiangmaiensis]|nr:flavodoxin family protein [Ameyamaea chiangmaiensis]